MYRRFEKKTSAAKNLVDSYLETGFTYDTQITTAYAYRSYSRDIFQSITNSYNDHHIMV